MCRASRMKTLSVLSRIYVEKLEGAIEFYETLLGEKCSLRFEYREKRLELARVGSGLATSSPRVPLRGAGL